MELIGRLLLSIESSDMLTESLEFLQVVIVSLLESLKLELKVSTGVFDSPELGLELFKSFLGNLLVSGQLDLSSLAAGFLEISRLLQVVLISNELVNLEVRQELGLQVTIVHGGHESTDGLLEGGEIGISELENHVVGSEALVDGVYKRIHNWVDALAVLRDRVEIASDRGDGHAAHAGIAGVGVGW
ncbi:hypothetical protein BCR34DRAFT_280230 [Clohesyomyces aquaticus]|uniref:Uncharacterized protein n=1 Tax=Clohesyomyces aquaticus TaxID=1231657 RepID=A0A1Y1Y1J2_9PLEO|nr:hypothetical protein BCR34DRAFT_280230 [Clohesyomyces aquaticus]